MKDVQGLELKAAIGTGPTEDRVVGTLGRLGLEDDRVTTSVLRALVPLEVLASSRERESLLWDSTTAWGRL